MIAASPSDVSTSCCSRKRIKHFVQSRIPENEKQDVQNHLMECERCMAVYFELLNQAEVQITESIAEADFIAEKKFDAPVRNQKTTAIIASMLFVAAAAVFWIMAGENKVENNMEKKPPLTKNQSKVPSQISGALNEKEKIFTEKQQQPGIQKAGIGKIEKSFSDKSIAIAASDDKSPPLAQKSDETTIEQKSPDESARETFQSAISGSKVFLQENNPNKEIYDKKLQALIQHVNESKFSEAISEANKFLYYFPDDINGRYYRGLSYYQLQQNDNALNDLQWIMEQGNNAFFADAQWHKALILNRKGDFDNSRKVLTDIIISNSPYSSQAYELLDLVSANK